MVDMTDIIRKKTTGEPGNGGQFGHRDRPASAVTLGVDEDAVTLGTDRARVHISDYEIDREVEQRSGTCELRDTTALAIARGFGKLDSELSLMGHSGHGSRSKAYQELSEINQNRAHQSPRERARVDALFTWLLNGGDNDEHEARRIRARKDLMG